MQIGEDAASRELVQFFNRANTDLLLTQPRRHHVKIQLTVRI